MIHTVSDISSKSIIAVIAGVLSYLKGSFNELLVVLAILMVCDYISGVTAALSQGTFSVAKGLRGAVKKAFYLFLVLIGFLIDYSISYLATEAGLTIVTNGAFGIAITCYLIGTEGLSVVKCLVWLGLPVPDFVAKAFGKIRDRSDKIAGQEDSSSERDQ